MSTGDGVVHNTGIVIEQGGNVLDAQAGSVVDIQSGAFFKINGVDKTTELIASLNEVIDYQKVVGISDILISSVGTWTKTRVAQGDYVLRHTAADDTSVIGIDITEAIRTSAGKGLKLVSVDVIHKIGTIALDAHTATLQKVAYANNVAVAVTSVPLTGSLSVNTQTNPYVDNLAVTTPAYDNTAKSKYVFELTVNAAATTTYDFYGLCLNFTRSSS